MPYIPSIQQMDFNSVQIINAIRNELGANAVAGSGSSYANVVPVAQMTNESIREIGNIVVNNEVYRNEFLTTLMNRIGRVMLTNKLFTNPWKMFKKGMLEYGETVEEIFVSLAKAQNFDPSDAENTLFKRNIPDVSTAFHRLNYQKLYPTTVTVDQLRQAFLSMAGITDLISKVIESLYTSAEYDEFIMMKYMLARLALDGKIKPVSIASVNATNANDIVTTIKSISNKLVYMRTDFNMVGVPTHTPKNEQNIVTDANFDAVIDVNVLARAFNMEKAEFMGKRVGMDTLTLNDEEMARLAILFEDESSYVPFTSSELSLLAQIPAFILDDQFFMIFDNLFDMTSVWNPKGRYWNYFYHTWKIYSASPFANAVLFTSATSSVTSIQLSPATATVAKGSSLTLTANVVTTGFANKDVEWALNGTSTIASTITTDGILTVSSNETNTTLDVVAVSKFDPTVTATATITIS